jgi:Glycosyltransferases involved in cell wall biogenesis
MFEYPLVKKVSVVIPVYNEQDSLPELIRRTDAACATLNRDYEILLVDDGSSDDSARMLVEAAEAPESHIVAVLLNRNYGQHSAIMAGFSHVTGDLIITLDADLQNPPEEIPKLIEQVKAGHDVVGTIRARRQDTMFRKTVSRMVNGMVRWVSKAEMHDYGCMLRAYRREIIQALLACHETTRFIPLLANSFAANPVEIEVAHAERSSGDSKYSFFKLVNLYLDLLTCMSTLPLRLASIVGAVMSLVGVLSAVILIGGRLILGSAWAVDGTFTVFALVFVLLGGIYLALGIMGEYLARIYNDVRARPAYCIHKIVGGSNEAAADNMKNTGNPQ